jgi:hypothetical protein
MVRFSPRNLPFPVDANIVLPPGSFGGLNPPHKKEPDTVAMSGPQQPN